MQQQMRNKATISALYPLLPLFKTESTGQRLCLGVRQHVALEVLLRPETYAGAESAGVVFGEGCSASGRVGVSCQVGQSQKNLGFWATMLWRALSWLLVEVDEADDDD